MMLADLPDQAAFRARARAWIRSHAPWDRLEQVRRLRFAGQAFEHERDWLALARQWQKKKFDAGWSCLVWPKAYGGAGLTPAENVIFQEEEGPFAELASAFMIGQGFIAPTLMAYASEEQKRALLPALASGSEIWCQLFSEPGAGSDLAGVRMRAEPVSGGWRLTGQKVWTSGAHHSDWGLALVRTDPDLPKHKGLTMFFVAMSSPGITVRPIEQMNCSAHFNEVFCDEVFVPEAQRLGAINEGWKVAMTTLASERTTLGASVPLGFEEIFEFALQRRLDGSAPIDSEDVRLRLAEWYAKTTATRFGVYRMLSTLARGGSPGAESAVGKLVGAITTQDIAFYGLDLMGAQGLAAAESDPDTWAFHSMFAFGAQHRLEGGTDEVLRNVIAERVLGLPPDIRMDGGPFRDVPTAPPVKG